MFCKKCGKELKEGAKFCGFCGTPIFKKIVENKKPVIEKTAEEPEETNYNNTFENSFNEAMPFIDYQSSTYDSTDVEKSDNNVIFFDKSQDIGEVLFNDKVKDIDNVSLNDNVEKTIIEEDQKATKEDCKVENKNDSRSYIQNNQNVDDKNDSLYVDSNHYTNVNEASNSNDKRKNGFTLKLSISLIAVCVIVGCFFAFAPTRVTLLEEDSAYFCGLNGSGYLLADRNIMIAPGYYGNSKLGSKLSKLRNSDNRDDLAKLQKYTELFESISCNTDNNGNLSNNDKITVRCEYSKKLADELKIKFISTEKDYTVYGLNELEQIDIFKGIKVKIGYSNNLYVENTSDVDLIKNNHYDAFYDGLYNYYILSSVSEEELANLGYTCEGIPDVYVDANGFYYYYGVIDYNSGYINSLEGNEYTRSSIKEVLDYEVYKFTERIKYTIEDISNNMNSTLDHYVLKSYIDGVATYEIYTNNEVYTLYFDATLYRDAIGNASVYSCNLRHLNGVVYNNKIIS